MHSLGAVRRTLAEDQPLPPSHDRCAEALSLAELYTEERPGLLHFLSKRSGRDVAEDLLQQLFANVAAKNLSEIDAPRAYLFETAKNLLRDRARSDKRRGRGNDVSADNANLVAGDPVAHLEARDRLARLEEAVGRLKPLTQEIFLACRIDGYSYREIADRTGLSVKGVEKQMSRAIKQLGRHLQRHG